MASYQEGFEEQIDYDSQPENDSWHGVEDEESSVHTTTAGPLYSCIFGSQSQPLQESVANSHPDTEKSLVLRTSKMGYYESMLSRFKDNLMSSKLRKDEVLRDDNWMAWKSRIMQTLRKNRISGFPHGEFLAPDRDTDPAEYDAWDMIDQAIVQYIKANINNDQLISIPEFLEINSSTTSSQTSFQTWNILCQVYEAHTTQTANNIFRTLTETRANDSTNIVKHLNNMQTSRTKLANIGYRMEDHLFNGFLMSSLPKSWDSYTNGLQGVQAGSSRENPLVSTLALINVLKSEYVRRKAEGTSEDVTYHVGNTTNPKKRKREPESTSTCRICQYNNHTTDNCRWKSNGGYCTHCQ